MNEVDLIFYSGLNEFLYRKKEDNFILFVDEIDRYLIIQVDLTLKQGSFINNNYDKFIIILNNLLNLYNNNGNFYYKNITFNTIKYGNNILNNCIFLYNSKSEKEGYFRTKGQIEIFSIKRDNNINNNEIYFNGIIKLVQEENISVRNLINIGIQQIRAREVYDFLKTKEVFVISDYNKSHKTYYIEKFKRLLKSDIIDILERGV